MPKLTEDQKTENSLKRLIKNRIIKNKLQKYPRTLDVLAHNFLVDFPKFRDFFREKEDEKTKLTKLFEYLSEQI